MKIRTSVILLLVFLTGVCKVFGQQQVGCAATDFSLNYNSVTGEFTLTSLTGVTYPSEILSLDFGDGTTQTVWTGGFQGNNLYLASPSGVYLTSHTYSSASCGVVSPTLTFNNKAVSSCNGSISIQTQVIVDGNQSGNIVANVGTCGSYTYSANLSSLGITNPLWGFGDGGQSTLTSPTHTYQSNGTYVVTLQDANLGGCAYFIEVTVNNLPQNTFSWAGNCTNTQINFNAPSSSGVTYTWNFGDGSAIQTGNTVAHTYANAGNYLVTCTSTSGTCSSTSTQYVQAGQPSPVFIANDLCVGTAFSPQNLPTWASSYSWDFGDGSTDQGYLISHDYVLGAGVTQQNFTITLTTVTGSCPPVSYSDIITVSSPIDANFTSIQSGCLPLEYTFTPVSTDAATYQWNFSGTSTIVNTTPSSVLHTFGSAGNQTVSLSTINGACTNLETETITIENPTLSITSTSDVICGEGAVTLTSNVNSLDPQGNYTYSWSDGSNLIGTNPTLIVNSSGTYSLTLTSVNCGTSLTATKQITFLPSPIATNAIQTQGIDCPLSSTGVLSLTIPTELQTLGYTVNGSTNQTAPTFNLTGLSEGPVIYTIAYTNYPTCSYVGNATISYTGPTLSLTSTPSGCTTNSGSASVNLIGSGGINTIEWAAVGSSQVVSTNSTYANAGQGFYTVTVNTTTGCELTGSVQVGTSGITVNSQDGYTCNGGTAQVVLSANSSYPSETFTYAIVSPQGQAGAISSTPSLTLGNYIIEVTGNQSGCTAQHSVSVLEAPQPIIDFSITPISCVEQGSISANVYGGIGAYSYDWGLGINSPTLSNLSAGTYSVTVTDETTGCQVSGSQTLVSATSLSIAGVSVTGCEASVSLSGIGTPSYLIEWSDQSGGYSTTTSNLSINTLPGGVYDVTITDALGCSDTYTNVNVGANDATAKSFSFVFFNADYEAPEDETKEFDELLAENMTEAADFIQEQLSSCMANQAATKLASFKQNCFSSDAFSDRMSVRYWVRQEQYMLYYYDRAGSLTKTVPPEGVEFLTVAEVNKIKTYRKSGNLLDGPQAGELWEPNHRLYSTYEYNALGQLKSQKTPDGGESRFIYDGLQRLRFSQSARQAAIGRYSYVKYDELGRTIESGESDLAGPDFNNLFSLQNATYTEDPLFPQTGNTQVTRSVFSILTSVDYYGESQTFLQNRISYITRDEDGDFLTTEDQYVTYYSYDVHGNVKWLVQHDPIIGRNYIKYHYDLISGNVLDVSYNEFRDDKFFHRYEYDADNRLTNVATSRDGVMWDQDIAYDYYVHGPLKSKRLGEDNIQQIDFTYTLQGWLKSINQPNQVSELTQSVTTISQGTTISNDAFLSDAFGMSLNYYQGDFVRTDQGNPYSALSSAHVSGGSNDLYNGNIRSWNWKTATGSSSTSISMTMVYQYDKLQRIKSATSHTYDVPLGTLAQNADNRFNTNYSFDRNGNMLSLQRNDHQGNQMDNLSYTYQDAQGNALTNVPYEARTTNQLKMVLDASNSVTDGENGDLIGSHNYVYDASGNLVSDVGQEYLNNEVWEVDLAIEWTVDHKVKQIHKTGNSINNPSATIDEWVRFHYDPMGVRIGKTHIDDANNPVSTARHTRYVLDAQGNTMGVYQIKVVDAPVGSSFDYQAILSLIERPIYGAERVGTDTKEIELQTWEFNAGQAPMFTYNQNGLNVLSELNNWITPLLKTTPAGGATLCECDIHHTYFDYNPVSDDYTFTDQGSRVRYYGKTANGVAVGERTDGTLETYATIAAHYLGDQTVPLVFNINNKLIKGTETLVTADANSKPIFARVPSNQGKYHLVHLDENQHPVIHTVDMTQPGWNAQQPGKITSANQLIDDQYSYGAHMTLLEDQANNKNLLYMTRYLPSTTECIGETELVVVEITPNGISAPQFLTRIESGDENGLGELQLSTNATEIVYYNRLNSIAGFEHRMVELNIFGLSGDHAQITTRTVLVQQDDYAGTYGKASVDFDEASNGLMFSQQGVYEQNESSLALQDGSEKQVMYYNRLLNTYEFGTPQGEYQYNEVRRGKDKFFYVPTEAEANSYAQWLGATPSNAPISTTQGYVLYSSLPNQPHTITQSQTTVSYTREIGYKHYELTDHLGNVRYVIGDARMFVSITGTTTDYEITNTDQQIAWSDYYPYGMYLTTRHVENESYRYGFQGQEMDDEIKGEGNSANYKYRMHDPRVGRFFAVDPLADKYPWYTPYQYAGNSVIGWLELEGLEQGTSGTGVEPITHTVESGESPTSIADEYGISIWDLARNNQGSQEGGGHFNPIGDGDYHRYWSRDNGNWSIRPGDVLNITPDAQTNLMVMSDPHQQALLEAYGGYFSDLPEEIKLDPDVLSYYFKVKDNASKLGVEMPYMHFVSEKVTPEIYKFTYETLWTNPDWINLHYGGVGTGSSKRRALLKDMPRPPSGMSRDEFPYASTEEGGPGSKVRIVPVKEQYIQGGQLSVLYRSMGYEAGKEFYVVLISNSGGTTIPDGIPVLDPYWSPKPLPIKKPQPIGIIRVRPQPTPVPVFPVLPVPVVVPISDSTLKSNITEIDNAMEVLMQLNGYYYGWKSPDSMTKYNYNVPDSADIGVLAQDVQRVLPAAVDSVKDKLGVHYYKLIPILIEAIQEENAKIEELRLIINKQQELLNEQKEIIDKLLKND